MSEYVYKGETKIFKSDETFQRRFYEWRRDRRMTLRFIKGKTGILIGTLSDYEHGRKDVPREDLMKLAKCLEISPNQLINP